jgi:hypothetical protein
MAVRLAQKLNEKGPWSEAWAALQAAIGKMLRGQYGNVSQELIDRVSAAWAARAIIKNAERRVEMPLAEMMAENGKPVEESARYSRVKADDGILGSAPMPRRSKSEELRNLEREGFNTDNVFVHYSEGRITEPQDGVLYLFAESQAEDARPDTWNAVANRVVLKKNARILFASTSEVYGDPLVNPQPESYLGNVNCIGERGCYDEAKRYGEALTMAYKRQHNIDCRIVRIFNTFGSRMRPDDGRVIPSFFSEGLKGKALPIFGDGKQTRSLCHVSDMVQGIYELMESDIQIPVNIGNTLELTILQIADKVNEATGNKTPEATIKR